MMVPSLILSTASSTTNSGTRNHSPDHRLPEAILDLDIHSRGIKNSMDEVFQLAAADVVQFVSRHYLGVGH